VGLGVMGWADLLFTLGIPYDSEEALELAERLMAFVKDKGHDQSARLAEERGPFPHWGRSIYRHGRPLRNATVTTIAPTGTISMLAGCSSGIEPLFALAFEHRVKGPDGERVLTFVSETFERLARARGFHSAALMAKVARRGSRQSHDERQEQQPPPDEQPPTPPAAPSEHESEAPARWLDAAESGPWCETLSHALRGALAARIVPQALLAAAEQWKRGRCVVLACPQADDPAGPAWAFVLWPLAQAEQGTEGVATELALRVGATVTVSLAARHLLLTACIVYGLPLAVMLGGALLGWAIVGADLGTAAGAAAGLAVAVVAVRWPRARFERAVLRSLVVNAAD